MATIEELYQQSLLSQQPPMVNLPAALTPYQRIMGQMTPTINPYTGAGVAIAGYNPALYNRMSGSGLLNLGGGGRGISSGSGGDSGGGGGSGGVDGYSGLATYGSNQSLTDGLLGAMLGLYSQPSFDVTVENAGTYSGMPSYDYGSSMTGVGNPGESDSGGSGGYGGTSSDTGVGNPGESYNMGGLVDRVAGPNPPGPDDGAGYLQLGEYVIKKSAVKKYGQGLLDMINNGKISAKKMKSLLG